jgi:hypothetical protein
MWVDIADQGDGVFRYDRMNDQQSFRQGTCLGAARKGELRGSPIDFWIMC